MAVIYSITVTNAKHGKYSVQTFTAEGWTTVGSLSSRKKAVKYADLYAEATGLGVRIEVGS